MDEQGLVLLSLTFFFFFPRNHTLRKDKKKTSFPSALVDTVELYLSQKMLGFIVVFARCDDLNKSCWTDGYLFSSFFFLPQNPRELTKYSFQEYKELVKVLGGREKRKLPCLYGQH